jgi:two-component system, LytTR family, sensor histidine kinase AlgZ
VQHCLLSAMTTLIMGEPVGHRAVYIETLVALVAWKRLIPLALVILPIVMLQKRMSRAPLAGFIGVVMCAAFVLIAPAAWRMVAPYLSRDSVLAKLTAVAAYGALGVVVVWLVGVILPHSLDVGLTLITTRASLIVCVALFWVGGWGLARDIDMEINIAREQRRSELLERTAKHAELLALRQHLDPHFLFNTLNAIAEWCREDPKTAERAILQLSTVLRTVMEAIKQPFWPLEEELKLAESVFALHALRNPDRFTVERDVQLPACSLPVPPMVLLPLAENAMKHGPEAGHYGKLALRVLATETHVEIQLGNPGLYRGRRADGEGLRHVEERLALVYGARATFTIAAEGTDRTLARVVLPLEAP